MSRLSPLYEGMVLYERCRAAPIVGWGGRRDCSLPTAEDSGRVHLTVVASGAIASSIYHSQHAHAMQPATDHQRFSRFSSRCVHGLEAALEGKGSLFPAGSSWAPHGLLMLWVAKPPAPSHPHSQSREVASSLLLVARGEGGAGGAVSKGLDWGSCSRSATRHAQRAIQRRKDQGRILRGIN